MGDIQVKRMKESGDLIADSDSHRVKIMFDDVAENPREWYNLGTVVINCDHVNVPCDRRDSPDTFWKTLASEISDEPRKISKDEVSKYFLMLPIYIYDHSGVTISTTPFSCSWDSGQVGYIYVSHDTIKKEYGKIDTQTLEQAKNVLIREIQALDDYLTGTVYGYVLYAKNTCRECGHTSYDEVDSCWGYFGDIEDSGILDEMPEPFRSAILDYLK